MMHYGIPAYRLPREMSIVRPASFCPKCQRPIPWWANVPILAYIFLRGRCLMCGAAIPFRYFLAELALGSAAAHLYLNFALPDAIGTLRDGTGARREDAPRTTARPLSSSMSAQMLRSARAEPSGLINHFASNR